MKTTIMCVVLFVTFICNASTWTIHAWKDNTAYVALGSNQVCITDGVSITCGMEWSAGATFDWTFDQQYPDWADSGCQSSVLGINGYESVSQVIGFQSSYNLYLGDVDPSGTLTWMQVEFSSYAGVGGPNWDNWQELNLPDSPGDYWLDFAPNGVGRISISQPIDFGKWAWDGSINPSWVEPLAARKQHGKGHQK